MSLSLIPAISFRGTVGYCCRISSGIFGFPKDRCAEIFLEVIEDYLVNSETTIDLVRLCNIDSLTVNIFKEKFHEKFNI